MRPIKFVSASALLPALIYAPLVTVLLTAVLLFAGAALLRWFSQQVPTVRTDVIRLIRALRGN